MIMEIPQGDVYIARLLLVTTDCHGQLLILICSNIYWYVIDTNSAHI